MALTGEVGELAELFQWLTAEESSAIMQDPRRTEQARHELADVLGYVLRLADVLHVDLAAALQEKMVITLGKKVAIWWWTSRLLTLVAQLDPRSDPFHPGRC